MDSLRNEQFAMTPSYYAKRVFWWVATPVFPFFQYFLQGLFIAGGLVAQHEGRQDFYLGNIAPGKTIDDLVAYLSAVHGFGNHFVALFDPGQVASLRRLHNFKYQYHLRIFADGEVRGHYELTPESHPFKHMKGEDFHDRQQDFVKWLGDWVTRV